MYEILFVTNIYNKYNNIKKVKAFHICEAPGTFILASKYYLNKFYPNIKYSWKATSLNPKFLDKDGIGDTYGLLQKYKKKWSFGKDETGDITKEENIKYYKKICEDCDFIIGDCGIPWTEDKNFSTKLYYS
jgi:cap2 methyltransferase